MRELLAYSQGAVLEEKIVLRIKADGNGDIRVPVAGYSSEGVQNCEYNWNVSIDGGNNAVYSGNGRATKIRMGYGYTPLSTHTVKITPVEESYGWLRAFGYHNSGAESYLVNIISDQSYKGFALSDIFCGDYYKYCQYYGCINLINTDEERLPGTLEIIGNNYRAYEYYGCVKLRRGADEKVLKSVKAIGNYYRAHQYEGCTGIQRMDLRAINRATIGSNYRYKQLNGVATNKTPYDIYVEGGIVEGGSWGLTNDNVKRIYVYSELIEDYKVQLSGITASKIVADNNQSNRNHEYIEVVMEADINGEIRIPVAGYSNSGTQDCAYDWKITIGNESEEVSGTGSDSYISVGNDLTTGEDYRVIIEPSVIEYGWARAFGFYGSGAESYIKGLIHDSYKGYADSLEDTGDYFKYRTYKDCIWLENSYERMPTSVETIGDYCYAECYSGCVGIETAHWEVLPYVNSIGTNYRYQEYYGCSGLQEHQGIAGSHLAMGTNYKEDMFSGAGDELDLYITRYETVYTHVLNSSSRYNGGTMTLWTCGKEGTFTFEADLVGTSGNTRFDIVIKKNGTTILTDTAPDPGTKHIKFDISCSVGDVFSVVAGYQQRYGYMDNIKLNDYNVLRLDTENINNIYCNVDDIPLYLRNVNRPIHNRSKRQAYFYMYICMDIDVTRLTKLVWTKSVSGPSGGEWGNSGLAVSNTKMYTMNGYSRSVSRCPWISYGDMGGDTITLGHYEIYDYNVYRANEGIKLLDSSHIMVALTREDYPNYAYGSIRIYDLSGGVPTGTVISSIIPRITDNHNAVSRGLGASKNLQYLFCNVENTLVEYYTPTKNSFTGAVQSTHSGMSGDVQFSDDGMKMYYGGKIWNLSAPRYIDSKVDSGVVCPDGVFHGKYRYVYSGGKLSKYEYE